MKVYFIGAGPGAPDLLTIRGRDLIARCPICIYAGSLVPGAIVELAPPEAHIVNSAPLSLDDIVEEFEKAKALGQDVARIHSGDPSLYGAIGEQISALAARNIAYEIVPGVPAFAAAAASLGCELTLPAISQSVILTRTSSRSSKMPERETLANLALSGATLSLHLSIRALPWIVEEITPFYGPDCPVAVVVRASWPDELIIRGTLDDIALKAQEAGIERTAMIIVGKVLSGDLTRTSALYDRAHSRHLKETGDRD